MKVKKITAAIIGIAAAMTITAVAATIGVSAKSDDVFVNRSESIVKSDINGDGIFDRQDYNGVQKILIDRDYSAYKSGADSEYDVNGDGKTDVCDFLLLKQQYSYNLDGQLQKEAEDYGFDYQREDGRVLVWHEEFDENELNEDNWTWRQTMGSSRTIYVNDETTYDVTDGNMHMIASASGDENRPYKNCMGLTTYDKMLFKYGYAEVKAILSTQKSTWQSWWLVGEVTRTKWFWHSEIDIFESDATEGAVALHKHRNDWNGSSHQLPALHEWPNRYRISEDEYEDYHIYSFEWSENRMIFAVDGEVYADFDEKCLDWDRDKSIPANDAGMMGLNTPLPGIEGFQDYVFMIFNNEFVNTGNGGDSEFGTCATLNDMPIEYYIDYVRLWQYPTTEGVCIGDDIKEHEYKNGTTIRTTVPPTEDYEVAPKE